jgi:hypothetical protein
MKDIGNIEICMIHGGTNYVGCYAVCLPPRLFSSYGANVCEQHCGRYIQAIVCLINARSREAVYNCVIALPNDLMV